MKTSRWDCVSRARAAALLQADSRATPEYWAVHRWQPCAAIQKTHRRRDSASAPAGERLHIRRRRQLQGGFQKTPQTANMHLTGNRLHGLCVNTGGSNQRVRSSLFSLSGGTEIVFLNVKLLSLSPPLFSSYVSEIPNFPPKWRPRVGRMSRGSRPYPWPPNHGTELPFSSGLGRWDLTLS